MLNDCLQNLWKIGEINNTMIMKNARYFGIIIHVSFSTLTTIAVKSKTHNFQISVPSTAQDKDGVANVATYHHTLMYTRNIGQFS